MRMRRRLWFSSLLMIVFVAIISLSTVRADTPLETGWNVRIEAATASPAQQGEAARIRFRIVNESTATFHVIGIDVPVADMARLVADVGEAGQDVLDSIGVPAGETLDLTTSHLYFETAAVTRNLQQGETLDMTLQFVGGQLNVPVHVHDSSSGC